MDRYGGRPIFLLAAAIVLAIAFWFRRQLRAAHAGVRPGDWPLCASGRGLR